MADPVVWFELEGSEPEQTAKFYSELFGWHTQTFPEAGYTTIDTHAGAGINGGIGAAQGGKPSAKVYVLVDDLQAALDKVAELGGAAVVAGPQTPLGPFPPVSGPAGNAGGLLPPPPDPAPRARPP